MGSGGGGGEGGAQDTKKKVCLTRRVCHHAVLRNGCGSKRGQSQREGRVAAGSASRVWHRRGWCTNKQQRRSREPTPRASARARRVRGCAPASNFPSLRLSSLGSSLSTALQCERTGEGAWPQNLAEGKNLAEWNAMERKERDSTKGKKRNARASRCNPRHPCQLSVCTRVQTGTRAPCVRAADAQAGNDERRSTHVTSSANPRGTFRAWPDPP